VFKTILRERFSAPKNHVRDHWTWELEKPNILMGKQREYHAR
jgi:hypothetical protein